jgi:hypothetical protein
MNTRIFTWLVSIQSTYTLVTALWPIVHITSFMEITGYKTDVWLVKTVGALLIPVASTLASFLFFKAERRPAIILGSLTAVSFIVIDFYYAFADVISNIYLTDGAIEIIFLGAWIVVFVKSTGE